MEYINRKIEYPLYKSRAFQMYFEDMDLGVLDIETTGLSPKNSAFSGTNPHSIPIAKHSVIGTKTLDVATIIDGFIYFFKIFSSAGMEWYSHTICCIFDAKFSTFCIFRSNISEKAWTGLPVISFCISSIRVDNLLTRVLLFIVKSFV